MTREELISRARLEINETDALNSHFDNTDLIKWLDDWHVDMCTFLEWPRGEAEVTGGAVENRRDYEVDISKALKILKVYFDGEIIELVDEDFLDAQYPGWRNSDAGKPKYAYMIDTDVLGVYPKPDADSAGKEILIKYVRNPDALDEDSDVPDLPIPYHITGPVYIAFKANASLGNVEDGARLWNVYHKIRMTLKMRIKSPERKRGWEWHGNERTQG